MRGRTAQAGALGGAVALGTEPGARHIRDWSVMEVAPEPDGAPLRIKPLGEALAVMVVDLVAVMPGLDRDAVLERLANRLDGHGRTRGRCGMTASDRRYPVRGVNLVLLSDGREVHLDGIITAAEGQAVLDDLDGAILGIEDQLAQAEPGTDPSWRTRAETALKKKRRQRPALQQLIAALRRAERQAETSPPGAGGERRDARRKAFIDAAEELLPAEPFTEIWTRAAERAPTAFSTAEGGAS